VYIFYKGITSFEYDATAVAVIKDLSAGLISKIAYEILTFSSD